MKTYQDIIESLKNAEHLEDLDIATKEAAKFLNNVGNDVKEKEAVRLVIKQKTDAIIATSMQLIKQTDEIISQSQAERAITISVGEQQYNTKEWMTYGAYCKAYNLNSTVVVTNWIKRGIVPPSNILNLKELNLKLIKAMPYKA